MFFFFNDTATTEIYTLSLHDALPISSDRIDFDHRPELLALRIQFLLDARFGLLLCEAVAIHGNFSRHPQALRSEEHTSELQSQSNLVCRLLLEKKKNISIPLLM